MILKLKRTPGIYLVGFMGSGKSTIGRLVADELGWKFVDMDEEIEAEQGRTIASIFDNEGEAWFRQVEVASIHQRVRQVQTGRPTVLALGGGAFTFPETAELLNNNGVTIWLDCPWELVSERVGRDPSRPLARDPDRFQRLFEERRAAYAQADYRIEIRGDNPAETVRAILGLPIF